MRKKKPTIKQRLCMDTPDFFKRWGNRIAGAFAGLAASGAAIVVASQQEGLPEKISYAMQWAGGAVILVSGVAGGIVKFFSMLVYDENKQNHEL